MSNAKHHSSKLRTYAELRAEIKGGPRRFRPASIRRIAAGFRRRLRAI